MSLGQIDHIVVLMLENRSFDSMLGKLCPKSATFDGLDGTEQNPDSSSLLKIPRQNESSLIQFFYHESVEARMRGAFTDQGQLFSYISPEARVRTDHPL